MASFFSSDLIECVKTLGALAALGSAFLATHNARGIRRIDKTTTMTNAMSMGEALEDVQTKQAEVKADLRGQPRPVGITAVHAAGRPAPSEGKPMSVTRHWWTRPRADIAAVDPVALEARLERIEIAVVSIATLLRTGLSAPPSAPKTGPDGPAPIPSASGPRSVL